uniref:Uncharacterized protein n=1 Tax=Rhizophora mucronata TaxID=61149 RepID=A0A2P2PPP0_RHIMU
MILLSVLWHFLEIEAIQSKFSLICFLLFGRTFPTLNMIYSVFKIRRQLVS